MENKSNFDRSIENKIHRTIAFAVTAIRDTKNNAKLTVLEAANAYSACADTIATTTIQAAHNAFGVAYEVDLAIKKIHAAIQIEDPDRADDAKQIVNYHATEAAFRAKETARAIQEATRKLASIMPFVEPEKYNAANDAVSIAHITGFPADVAAQAASMLVSLLSELLQARAAAAKRKKEPKA